MAHKIDQRLALEKFFYDPETGSLLWANAGKRWIGKEAGAHHIAHGGKEYRRVFLNNAQVYAHRIIWVMMTGEDPESIDHIDGDGLNNRWSNLRSVAHRENGKNQRLHSTNTSGHIGISYRKDSGRWRARIMVDGTPKSIGTYASLEDAIAARKAANSEYGFHENHGMRNAQ